MTEFAQEPTQVEARRRGIPFQHMAAAALSAVAFFGPAAGSANAKTEQPFQVAASIPQYISRPSAQKIIVPPVLDAVAGCESGSGPDSPGDYTKESYSTNSDASGRYQMLGSTWRMLGGKGQAKNAPPWEQDKRAVKLYKLEGLRPWYESRRCWAGKIAVIRSKKEVSTASAVVGRIGKVSVVVRAVAPLDQRPGERQGQEPLAD